MILTCFESEGATLSPWPLGLAFKFRWGWIGLTLRVGVTKFFMLNAPEAMSFLNLPGFQTFQSKNDKCFKTIKSYFIIEIQYFHSIYRMYQNVTLSLCKYIWVYIFCSIWAGSGLTTLLDPCIFSLFFQFKNSVCGNLQHQK